MRLTAKTITNGVPSASAMLFMESAVPIVLQWPGLGADASVISINSSFVIFPAATWRRASQRAMPEPASFPLW